MGVAFLITVGTLLNISELFVMAGGLGALAFFSYLLARACARQIALSYSYPALVAAGQPFDLAVTLERAHSPEHMRLQVSLDLPPELDLLSIEKREPPAPAPVVWRCRMQARERGEHWIGQVTVTVQDPVGLYNLRKRTPDELEVLAWPTPLDPLTPGTVACARQTTGPQESEQRALDGSSPYTVRQWAPGDSLRRVHWPSTARIGRLAVMEFEHEISRDLRVILDSRQPKDTVRGPDRFETACKIASFLLHEAWNQNHRACILSGREWLGGSPSSLEAGRREALSALALAQPEDEQSLEAIVREALAPPAFAGNTVLICCRWDEDAEAALGALRALSGSASALLIDEGEKRASSQQSSPLETRQTPSGVYIVGADEIPRP